MTRAVAGPTPSRASALGQGLGARVRTELAQIRLPLVVGLYLAVVVLPISFDLGPVRLTGARVVLMLLIVPMTIRLFRGAYGRLILPDYLFFLHVLWFSLALLVNNPGQMLESAGSTGIEFIGGYVLGRATIRDRATFVALVRAMGLLCLLLLPFVISETLTGRAVILRALDALPGVRSLADIEIGKRLGLFRAQSVFAHPIHSGLFFILTFSLCFVGLNGVYGHTRRWIVSIACGLCAFLALSSGALLALVLQLGLIFWSLMFRNVRSRWWLLLALFAVMYVVIAALSNRPPIRVFLSYAAFSPATAYGRELIFEYGMLNIRAHPLFGIGLNDWVRLHWMTASVDNFWLLVAMRYGIPAFVFLAWGYVWALFKVGLRDFDADRGLWLLRRAWMFSFVGLSFTLCTVHVWHTLFSFVFFMFGAGMWLLTATPQGEGEAPEAAPLRQGPRYSRFPVEPGRRARKG